MTKAFTVIVPEAYRDIYAAYKYAPAIRIGKDIHVSGIIGANPDLSVPEDYDAQVRNIFRLLETILAETGATLADVYSLTSYHVGDLAAQTGGFIAVQAERLGTPHPAWTAVGISQLAVPGALLEVSAMARVQ